MRHHGVAISALNAEGLQELLERVATTLFEEDIPAIRRQRLQIGVEGTGA
jgi:hypothetical protein